MTTNGFIESVNTYWAAGNMASPLIHTLDIPLDKSDRAIVNPDLSIPGNPNIFVIGDAARVIDKTGKLVPGVAPAANQEAEYVAKNIASRLKFEDRKPFEYKDKGSLATIGMAKAVAQFTKFKFSGLLAWLLWTTLHIFFLINFRTKLRVFFEWCWFYLTNQPGARLIVYHKNKIKDT
jgi:NADH dehydrogenase